MSDLQVLINSSMGAVFFVSGAIAVLVLLAIFILKKGNDIHSVLGYLFFFGLSFANYSAAISYYQGYLPFAAISITIPVSTVSLILGLAAIIPKSKSLWRIRTHIVSCCISATSVAVGTMINWYHFKVMPLDLFRWNDFTYLFALSIPLMIVGGIVIFYFFIQSDSYFSDIANQKKPSKVIIEDLVKNRNASTRSHTILVSVESTMQGDDQPIPKALG